MIKILVNLFTFSLANFKCSSGEVIPSAKFCDGRRDCADGSDEITNESSITNRTLKYQRFGKVSGYLHCYVNYITTKQCDLDVPTRQTSTTVTASFHLLIFAMVMLNAKTFPSATQIAQTIIPVRYVRNIMHQWYKWTKGRQHRIIEINL